jgi:DNA-binding CsgD family transcriptional regulator
VIEAERALFRKLSRRHYQGFVRFYEGASARLQLSEVQALFLADYFPLESDAASALVARWVAAGRPRTYALPHPTIPTQDLLAQAICWQDDGRREWALLLQETQAANRGAPNTGDRAEIEKLGLSPRLKELAWFLTQTDLQHKEIARAMEISEGTLRTHITRLFAKARVNSRLELASRLAESKKS